MPTNDLRKLKEIIIKILPLGFSEFNFLYSFLSRTGQPQRAKSSKTMEVLGDRQQTPCGLAGRQDLVQPVEGLVPQIISLLIKFVFMYQSQELENETNKLIVFCLCINYSCQVGIFLEGQGLNLDFNELRYDNKRLFWLSC